MTGLAGALGVAVSISAIGATLAGAPAVAAALAVAVPLPRKPLAVLNISEYVPIMWLCVNPVGSVTAIQIMAGMHTQ